MSGIFDPSIFDPAIFDTGYVPAPPSGTGGAIGNDIGKRFTATIHPLLGPKFVVGLAEVPQFTESERGGWQDATLTTNYPRLSERDWARDAAITIDGPFGPLYWGKIRTWQDTTISVQGWDSAVADSVRPYPGRYCLTDLSGWRETNDHGRNTNITSQVEDSAALACIWQAATDYPADAFNGFLMDFGGTIAGGTFVFTYTRPTQADWYFSVRPLVNSGGTAFDGESLQYADAIYTLSTSSGGTSGTVTLTLPACAGLRFYFHNVNHLLSSGATQYTMMLNATKLYLEDVAPTITDGAIVADAISRVPSYLMAGSDIAGSTALEPFEQAGNPQNVIGTVLDYLDGAFRWEDRGLVAPVAVYHPKPTAPAYTFIENGRTVITDLSDADSESMFSAINVTYQNSAGAERRVAVYDTDDGTSSGVPDATHYLVQIGRCHGGAYGAKWAPDLAIGQSTQAMAIKAGLATIKQSNTSAQITGTVTLRGTDPLPGYIKPGELCVIQTLDRGVVVSRIRSISKTGYHLAELTLDNTPKPSDMIRRAIERALMLGNVRSARAIPTRFTSKKLKAAAKANVASAKAHAKTAARKAFRKSHPKVKGHALTPYPKNLR